MLPTAAALLSAVALCGVGASPPFHVSALGNALAPVAPCNLTFTAPHAHDVVAGGDVTVEMVLEAKAFPVRLCLHRLAVARSGAQGEAAGECWEQGEPVGAVSLVVRRHDEGWYRLEATAWAGADAAAPMCVADVMYKALRVEAWEGDRDVNWWLPFVVPWEANTAAGQRGAVRQATRPAADTPPLSFQGLPNLLGPDASREVVTAPAATPRVLVATFAGGRTKPLVAATVASLFGGGRPCDQDGRCVAVDILLCLYDDSDWSDQEWVRSTHTVVVRARRQMKWWFVKRHIVPDATSGYDYLIMVDDDALVLPSLFSLPAFVHTMLKHGVAIGQPAHSVSNRTTYPFLDQRRDGSIGRWTSFVECGPFVAFHASTWRCVWDLLQPDIASGYGYDLVWGPLCAPYNTGIIDAQAVVHENVGVASKRPNGFQRMVAEGIVLFRRLQAGAWRGVQGVGPVAPTLFEDIQVGDRRSLPLR